MKYRFKAEEWNSLLPEERIQRCRILGNEARKLAFEAHPRFKPIYLEIAAQWTALANEIADHIRHEARTR